MPSDDTTTTQPPKTTTRRPGEKAGAEIREQGFALLLKGEHTRDDIAATLGVSRSSIDRWARYLGKKRSKATGARTRSQRRQNAPQRTPEAPAPAVAPAPAGALIDALVAAGEALFGTYPGLTGATFSRAPDGAVRVTYRRVIEQEFAL